MSAPIQFPTKPLEDNLRSTIDSLFRVGREKGMTDDQIKALIIEEARKAGAQIESRRGIGGTHCVYGNPDCPLC